MNTMPKNPLFSNIISKLPTVKQLLFTAFGIVLLIFLFLSLLSYHPGDSAWSHVTSEPTISNVGGRLGAWVADILNAFFGWASWLLVLILAYEIMRLWWEHPTLIWPIRALAYGFMAVMGAALFAYIGVLQTDELATKLGGAMGFELQRRMIEAFGKPVAALLMLVSLLAVAGLTFEVRWRLLGASILNWINEQRGRVGDERAADAPLDESATDADTQMMAVNADNADAQAYAPHNHEGTLESFLVHSGLREEYLAKHITVDELDRAAAYTSDAAVDAQADADVASEAPKDNIASKYANIAKKAVMAATGQRAQTAADSSQYADDADAPADLADDEMAHSAPIHADTAHHTGMAWVNELKNTDYPADDDDAYDDDYDATDGYQSFSADAIDEYDVKDVPSWQADVEEAPAASVATPKAQTKAQTQPAGKSHAFDTLKHRMSLTPIPELGLLDAADPSKKPKISEEQLAKESELLEIKLQEFNINATVVSAMVGPVVTRFEVDLASGVKASRVTRVAQDLARSMSKASLRVVEIIPGKPYIGIEVPNEKREMVRLIELLDTPDYKDPNKDIAIAVGKDISGKPVIADLAKAPHMLVAGTTGSGKSVLVNSFLLSMLLKYTPDELKLVLIDPKQLELANYGDIPHLLTPVITDMKDAVAALTWCVNEMERRYQLMSKLRVRKISEFNKKVEEAIAKDEPVYDPLWQANDSVSQSAPPKLKPLPTIVIVADEFADMIMQLGKTAEEPIVRLAQKARAAGIHLLLATQRPTVNVVTGLIKANVPARVALRVNSKVDSRTIIEEGGAEDMLGHGDMMFIGPGKNNPERMHGAYVDDDEVNRICDAWRERGSPDYIDLSESYTFEGEGSGDTSVAGGDELYEAAAAFVVETRKASISAVQRKFSIGYNRAARLLDQMEERGLVTAMDSGGKRQLLL